MIYLKNYIKKNNLLIKYIIIIFVLSLLFTLLEYVGISYKFLTTTLFIINIILIFINSFKVGIRSKCSGYKSGILFGIKAITLLFLINIISLNKISFKCIIYYLILMLISIIGSIIGKNKQKNYSSQVLE